MAFYYHRGNSQKREKEILIRYGNVFEGAIDT